MTYSPNGLGWTFNTEIDDTTGHSLASGLVLKNIRHDGHNFAHDVRLLGIWIEFDEIDSQGSVTREFKEFVTLDAKHFLSSAVSTIYPDSIVTPIREASGSVFDYLARSNSALKFSEYFVDKSANYAAFGLGVRYEADDLFANLAQANCLHKGLVIEQSFLFSRYASAPPHEPSGNLLAARFHPLVEYTLTMNPKVLLDKPHTRVVALRFDYRFHLYVDAGMKDKTSTGLYHHNQAGLFADSDGGTFGAVWKKTRHFGGLTANAKVAFSATEKPLAREVIAPALLTGSHGGKRPYMGDIVCWDNIHWWGAKATSDSLPSTPGAFHAIHVHWRWGTVLSSLIGRKMSESWRRFNPGTPLLDPRIPLQTIYVGVTKYRTKQAPSSTPAASLSKPLWEDLFHDSADKPLPEDISKGADLVLWYSTTVESSWLPTIPFPLQGTVFLHGMFFAHEPEPDVGRLERTYSPLGPRDPLYWPRSKADIERQSQWFRPAD